MAETANYNNLYSNKVSLPQGEAQIKHIFRRTGGHIEDTPENRKFLLDLVDEKNRLGTDIFGTDWYAKILSDGKQGWVRVRNGVIINGGINNKIHFFDPDTGLNNNPFNKE